MADQFSDDQPYNSHGNSPGAPPKKKSLKWLWIILALGGVGLLVCCGGMGGLAWFGLDQMGEAVKIELNKNPAVTAELGTIESAKMNFTKTGEAGQETEGAMVFDVTGDKGTGQFSVKNISNVNGEVTFSDGVLTTSDGKEILFE